MGFNTDSLTVNLIVTVMVFIMVFLMPWLDRKICTRLGISLHEGIDTNPDAPRILRIRKFILIVIFILYLLCVAYVTFLSRQPSAGYTVNSGPFLQGFANSFYIDFGFLDIINILFTEGIAAALAHIRIISVSGITQLYLNIVMLVPMGYLLPYIFDWFRQDVSRRTISACFLISVLIENIQLLTRHGMYDLDDIFANTLGGVIGQALFIAVAYVNTHPNWRRDLRQRNRWRRRAGKTALFPFAGRMHMIRSDVYTNDEETLRQFFDEKLGFFFLNESMQGNDKALLYDCGGSQIEVICRPKGTPIPPQEIMFGANNTDLIRKRLEKCGIETTTAELDEYSGRRIFSVYSPEGMKITFLEE